MTPFTKWIALTLWLVSAIGTLEFLSSNELGVVQGLIGLMTGLGVAKLFGLSASSNHLLFFSGAAFAAVSPAHRFAAIHVGPGGTLIVNFLLGMVIGSFQKPQSQSIGVMAWTAVFLAALELVFRELTVSQTVSGAIIGSIAMTLSLVFEKGRPAHQTWAGALLVTLCLMLAWAPNPTSWVSDSSNSRYSVITRAHPAGVGHSLFINGRVRYLSDEDRYSHACLIQKSLDASSRRIENALIVFGGDGMLARTLLSQKSLKTLTILDPDLRLIQLAKDHPVLRAYNLDSMRRPKTRILSGSVFNQLSTFSREFDLVVLDLHHRDLQKDGPYFSQEFISLIRSSMRLDAVASILLDTTTENASIFSTVHASFHGQNLGYYKDRLMNYGFIVTSSASAKPVLFPMNRCMSSQMPIATGAPITLKGIVTREGGGEERATRMFHANAARLSLPR